MHCKCFSVTFSSFFCIMLLQAITALLLKTKCIYSLLVLFWVHCVVPYVRLILTLVEKLSPFCSWMETRAMVALRMFVFQRRECGGCFPGGSKKDLPEHSGRQPGPERSWIRGPAQAFCPSRWPANQRSTASEGRMRLLMTNTTYSTFSSPLTSPITPAGLVLSRPAGVWERPTNRGNYTQAQLFVRDPSPLYHFLPLTWLLVCPFSSVMLCLSIGQYLILVRDLRSVNDGCMMVFNQRSVVLVNTMNVHKTSVRTENTSIPRQYWP